MKIATTLTRLLLLLYPPSFRREMGAALGADVRRRAAERHPLWLVPLTASLLVNAVGAWRDTVGGPKFGPPHVLPRAHRTTIFSWIDLKLAFRMLVKSPGLTLVGGLGIAVAMAIGVGFFALFYSRFYPTIPLPDGDRLVALENWDRRTHREERRALSDFNLWRADMKSVEDMTAFRTVSRNATVADGLVEVAQVAEITPSGFRLARVPPLLGRTLVDDDAAANAPPVVAIGFDVWRARFASDPGVVGQQLRLGDTRHSIVGVMPDGFAFPVNHQYWVPFKGAGNPSIFIAARLAPGVDIGAAHAELTTIGNRMTATSPDTHGQLRPEVLPYTYPFAGMGRTSSDDFWPMTVLVSLILVVVCVNVAILTYARTATRLGEIAVRSALGASRSRIVTQLFVESFVLSTGAAAIGLLIVKVALDWVRSSLASLQQANFWSDYTLTGTAVVYGIALAGLASLITGVIPALRATGRRVQVDLRQFTSHAGLRLGRTWTTLIVVQVSVASAALPIAVGLGWFQVRDIFNLPRFPVDQVLFAEVGLDRDQVAGQRPESYWKDLGADFARLQAALAHQLDAEPAVASYSFTTTLPNIGRSARVAIENDTRPSGVGREIDPSTVGIGFFRTFDVAVLAGRAFQADDFADSSAAVVVNRAFARTLLGQGESLGRRVRFATDGANEPADLTGPARPLPWLTIVGVVENIDANPFGDDLVEPRVYLPLKMTNWETRRVRLAVRIAASERDALARKLPQVAAALDPALQLDVTPLEEVYRIQRMGLTAAAAGIGVALLSVILLSAAGIYALMSFTVTQRRREIAIRTALGAQPTRLLGGIFRRALRQISIGVIIGVGVALLIDRSLDGEALAGRGGLILPLMVIVMAIVGLLAALGPARRGLKIDPLEALKSE